MAFWPFVILCDYWSIFETCSKSNVHVRWQPHISSSPGHSLRASSPVDLGGSIEDELFPGCFLVLQTAFFSRIYPSLTNNSMSRSIKSLFCVPFCLVMRSTWISVSLVSSYWSKEIHPTFSTQIPRPDTIWVSLSSVSFPLFIRHMEAFNLGAQG